MELERISPASLAVGCRHTILHTLSTAVSLQAILSPLIYMQLNTSCTWVFMLTGVSPDILTQGRSIIMACMCTAQLPNAHIPPTIITIKAESNLT